MNIRTLIGLKSYGTTEGAQKAWDTRGRGQKAAVRHKDYSWGRLSHVEFGPHGIDGRAVLHPEIKKEMKEKLDQGQEHRFKDEQGIRWSANKDEEGNVHFNSQGHEGLRGHVPYRDLFREKSGD